MTAQEIVRQVQQLPFLQQREVLQALSQTSAATELSETEIARLLLAQGVIKEIPPDWDWPEEDFEPIVIKGKPLSETILEDRN